MSDAAPSAASLRANDGRARGLVHPGAVVAIAILVVNDHLLKARYPGLVTGKVSDFAGLAFFPLFLQALAELAGARVSRRWLVACTVATGTVFAAVKTVDGANAAYAWIASWLLAPWAWARGAPWPPDVVLQQDATDLWALVALWLPWAWGRDRRA